VKQNKSLNTNYIEAEIRKAESDVMEIDDDLGDEKF